MKNFAMTGVAGFVAPRHLKAIRGHRQPARGGGRSTRCRGRARSLFRFNVRFFTEFERFDRHLEKLRRGPEADRVHYLSICSPNYLHDAHIRLALRVGADAICEKPLVINPWNLDALKELERETGRRVLTVLQLRVHPDLIALRDRLAAERPDQPHDVCLTYVTARGPWYDVSWKGREDQSGGLVTNIGVHFFDLLAWLFGAMRESELHLNEDKRMAGWLGLERAERALVPLDRYARPAVPAAARHEDDLPFDYRRRPGDRVQRGLREPSHARLRRSDGGSRVRHR